MNSASIRYAPAPPSCPGGFRAGSVFCLELHFWLPLVAVSSPRLELPFPVEFPVEVTTGHLGGGVGLGSGLGVGWRSKFKPSVGTAVSLGIGWALTQSGRVAGTLNTRVRDEAAEVGSLPRRRRGWANSLVHSTGKHVSQWPPCPRPKVFIRQELSGPEGGRALELSLCAGATVGASALRTRLSSRRCNSWA